MSKLSTMPTTWVALRGKVGNRADYSIGHNTTATLCGYYYSVRLHGHEIIRVHEDGGVSVRHCGWVSVTTFDRIRRFLPCGWTAGFAGGNPCLTNYETGERVPVGGSDFVLVRGSI